MNDMSLVKKHVVDVIKLHPIVSILIILSLLYEAPIATVLLAILIFLG